MIQHTRDWLLPSPIYYTEKVNEELILIMCYDRTCWGFKDDVLFLVDTPYESENRMMH